MCECVQTWTCRDHSWSTPWSATPPKTSTRDIYLRTCAKPDRCCLIPKTTSAVIYFRWVWPNSTNPTRFSPNTRHPSDQWPRIRECCRWWHRREKRYRRRDCRQLCPRMLVFPQKRPQWRVETLHRLQKNVWHLQAKTLPAKESELRLPAPSCWSWRGSLRLICICRGWGGSKLRLVCVLARSKWRFGSRTGGSSTRRRTYRLLQGKLCLLANAAAWELVLPPGKINWITIPVMKTLMSQTSTKNIAIKRRGNFGKIFL